MLMCALRLHPHHQFCPLSSQQPPLSTGTYPCPHRHRYLLALDGYTASSRLGSLLPINSAVLKQQSQWLEWCAALAELQRGCAPAMAAMLQPLQPCCHRAVLVLAGVAAARRWIARRAWRSATAACTGCSAATQFGCFSSTPPQALPTLL